jgi:flagellar P-ring protein FlgI
MIKFHCLLSSALLFLVPVNAAYSEPVRLKDLGRFQGWRDNPLVGYGIVTGLAGTGDSSRNEVTQQALRNALARLGISVTADQVRSRNVAVVMITAALPASANIGDKIDISVASIGDAISLAGGTLLMTPLLGPDQQTYALAQGPVVIGGYRFEADQNSRQKNYPTSGILSNGGTVERSVEADLYGDLKQITYILRDPDFNTAETVALGINRALGYSAASVKSADAIDISTENMTTPLNSFLAKIENVSVSPDRTARIVINERSGTVVAGGDVQISDVVIAQGDIKVSVSIDRDAVQPNIFGGFVNNARGLVISNTRLDVEEGRNAVMRFPGTSIAELIQGLSRAEVPTRTMIAILQAMKAAGALHADIIVQ